MKQGFNCPDEETTFSGGENKPNGQWPPPQWCRKIRLPSTNDMLIYGGFLLNMSTKGTIACFETLGAEYAMTHFNLTSAEAGSVFATFGTIGVVSLLSMRILCRYFNDVQIVLGGMSVMIVACLVFVTSPHGTRGLPVFMGAVFLMYSVGYPIGHTAVRESTAETACNCCSSRGRLCCRRLPPLSHVGLAVEALVH